ncbi:MAG: class I SAM-dependent methyltransferase [Thermoguttaceae bacterium]|jgi:SAM-dependent methyltransferase
MERAIPGQPRWAELAAPHLARYLAAAEHVRSRRVLDAGSGAGYGAALLKAAGAVAVQGVDADADAVCQARQRFAAPGLDFHVDDCETLATLASPFDVICCFEVIEHLQRPERFLAQAARLLAADGLLLVSSPDRAATPPFVTGQPRNSFHVHEWYGDEFRALLLGSFAEVELRVQVESIAVESRRTAVAALREGLMWSNPLLVFLWRKLRFGKGQRAWTRLAGLAAPAPADYPIVPAPLASVFGTPAYHFALCRGGRRMSPSPSGRAPE